MFACPAVFSFACSPIPTRCLVLGMISTASFEFDRRNFPAEAAWGITMRVRCLFIGGCLLSLLMTACKTTECKPSSSDPKAQASSPTSPAAAITPPKLADAAPSDYPGLHNVVAYSADLLSGSVPEGDAGFETLRALGIRTIISVDGAQPDLECARAHGLRYVHLPIGYDGMDGNRRLEIARAVKELPGPIYLHCHHGKHRSACAAGAAVVTLGIMPPDAARARMAVSGTSPNYKGLFHCVESATVASEDDLRAASDEFPESWKTSGLVRTMVRIEAAADHLKLIEKAGWKAPADHPDLIPVAEAGLLADLLRNLQDDEHCRAKPSDFLVQMLATSREAERLEELLNDGAADNAAMSGAFANIDRQCRGCHTAYRD